MGMAAGGGCSRSHAGLKIPCCRCEWGGRFLSRGPEKRYVQGCHEDRTLREAHALGVVKAQYRGVTEVQAVASPDVRVRCRRGIENQNLHSR
ncbi:unnamed protein product [Ectocarpus fasciculatus]